jgi:hypothetical protein
VDDYRADPYLVDDLPACAYDADPFSDYWKQVQSHDMLGCARGIVWALLTEAVLAIVALLFWELRLWPF